MFAPDYFRYWGKARPQSGDGVLFHLLPYHCLDVAAVGAVYLRRAPGLRSLFQRALACENDAALEEWIAFWLSLHDIGKFSEAFQSQRPDVFEMLRGRLPTREYTLRHDSLGMLFWQEVGASHAINEGWFGPDTESFEEGLRYWARAVTGHHGQPPEESCAYRNHFLREEDGPAILKFVADMRTQLFLAVGQGLPTSLTPESFEWASQELSWWMAGLAVLADWLGSNTEYFPYQDGHQTFAKLKDYWDYACKQAAQALDVAGVMPQCSVMEMPFPGLFPFITAPSPLQNWAVTTPIQDEPQIHLLEDVTGAGKTEAAVFLAHRLMAAGQADGFFVGLPTMATANAMYGRIAQVYARLFKGDASLALAHGQRHLVEAFAASVLPAGATDVDAQQGDETASARCNAWLADHNKRALLAPAGVGTIDQALLAVLHSKHQSLRLLGLLRKVLIVDEVHACDAYMQGILKTLLTFHARAGGSVILLSATLPQRMKCALVAAFAEGCGCRAPTLVKTDYPLVTTWHGGLSSLGEETAIATRADVQRTVRVDYVSDLDTVLARIETALSAGQCVCWMRNTVADALDAHALLRDRLPADKLTLFHARFTLRDRLRTERRMLELFGKCSTPMQRRGQLVVATQVAEQSLDADWDLVISDLAPIDRLIQRAGRLQRHPREPSGRRLKDSFARDQRGQPCLIVFGPAWTNAPGGDWFKSAFRKAANVYPHHGQLWLTARALQGGRFTMPMDARTLIESVFGEDVDMPPGLQHSANQAEGKAYSDASEAHQNTVGLKIGYQRGGLDWWSEAKTPSRLGEESISVVLARWRGDQLVPWSDHAELRHAWAYSTVRIAERLIACTLEPDSPARRHAMEEALLTLPGKGRWCVLLPLEKTDRGWEGNALGRARTGHSDTYELRRWNYCSDRGLLEVKAPDE